MNEFNSQFKNVQNIKLTESEKDLMRMNLRNIINSTKIESPYEFPSMFMKPVFSVFAAIVLVVIGGTGVSFSAANALPGDFLYGIKVHVNEEVAGVLISSPEQKLIWQEERVQKRILEIHTLAKAGSLTKEKSELAVMTLDNHISDLNKNAAELATSNPDIVKAVAATIDKETDSVSAEITAGAEISVQNEEIKNNQNTDKLADKVSENETDKIAAKSVEPSTASNLNTEEMPSTFSTILEDTISDSSIETPVTLLKTKISKEKEHLESLTTDNSTEVKSETSTTNIVEPIIQ